MIEVREKKSKMKNMVVGDGREEPEFTPLAKENPAGRHRRKRITLMTMKNMAIAVSLSGLVVTGGVFPGETRTEICLYIVMAGLIMAILEKTDRKAARRRKSSLSKYLQKNNSKL